MLMLSLGSRDKLAFYRPGNKSIISIITEEGSMQMIIVLCQNF